MPEPDTKVSAPQWNALLAGFLGWMLDAFDAMLFSFALVSLREEFHLSNACMGALASLTLLTSIGGVLFGMMADRVGRVRALSYSILTYSVFTALLATSRSLAQLVLWRALVGFGLGGEWAAGSALVAEVWPARHRGKAIGLMQSGWAIGYLLAAAVAASLLPRYGWRPLFLTGILPALLTFWIRFRLRDLDRPVSRSGEKSSLSSLFTRRWRRYTLTATGLSTAVLFAYWGLFTWVPTYLSTPLEKGGAGMSLFRSSAWIIPMQVGSFFGYTSFGMLSDRYGRRPIFALFVLAAAASVLVYGNAARHPTLLMITGPLVGFFGHGYFSVFGSLLAELFPASMRATAQAFCYNTGRALSAGAPMVIGFIAERFADRGGVGAALGLTAIFFAAGAILVYALPETKGKILDGT